MIQNTHTGISYNGKKILGNQRLDNGIAIKSQVEEIFGTGSKFDGLKLFYFSHSRHEDSEAVDTNLKIASAAFQSGVFILPASFLLPCLFEIEKCFRAPRLLIKILLTKTHCKPRRVKKKKSLLIWKDSNFNCYSCSVISIDCSTFKPT